MDTKIKDSLVMSAFYQAAGREHPEEGLVVHTDRGCNIHRKDFRLCCFDMDAGRV